MESLFWHQPQPLCIHEAISGIILENFLLIPMRTIPPHQKLSWIWKFNKSNYPADSSWTWKNSPFQFSSNVVLCKFRLACGDWTIWKGQLHICFQSSKTRDFQTKYAEYSCWKPLLPKDASPVQFRNHFITVIDKLDPRTIDWACTWTKSVHVWGGLAFHLFTAPPLSLAGKSMKHLHVKT